MTFDFNDDDPLHIETLAIRAGQLRLKLPEVIALVAKRALVLEEEGPRYARWPDTSEAPTYSPAISS